jgi:hypothetical protein
MRTRLNCALSSVPVAVGGVTLAGVAALLAWDASPRLFPVQAHTVLAALPLTTIAIAYLAYAIVRRQGAMELAKSLILSTAFLFWAANQLWPDSPRATLFNDIAIALFVCDVLVVIAGWPKRARP